MAQQGMRLRRPEHCLALAASAVDKVHGRVDTQTEALFAVTHAHALAKARQRPEAVREVERARTALSSAKGDDVPFWALSWGPPAATVHSRTAKVFETLGDRRRAAAMYGAAAASRPPGTYARIMALDLVAQAEMQAAEAASSRHAPPGAGPSATWTESSPGGPARPWATCAETCPASAPRTSLRCRTRRTGSRLPQRPPLTPRACPPSPPNPAAASSACWTPALRPQHSPGRAPTAAAPLPSTAALAHPHTRQLFVVRRHLVGAGRRGVTQHRRPSPHQGRRASSRSDGRQEAYRVTFVTLHVTFPSTCASPCAVSFASWYRARLFVAAVPSPSRVPSLSRNSTCTM